MGAVITHDTNFIEIDFAGTHVYLQKGKFRKSLIGSVCLLDNDEGVQIVTHDRKPIIVTFANVDNVDGDTAITSDALLYAALKDLM